MKKNVEMIKTLVLWILFVSSIALFAIRYNLIAYGILSDSALVIGRQYDLTENNIIPSHIVIKFNQYDITNVITDKEIYYAEANRALYNTLYEDSDIKKIVQEEFETAKKSENMLLIYDDIPSKYIEDVLNLKKTLISDIGYIREILFITNSQDIFIKTKDNFYKLTSKITNEYPLVKKLSNENYQKYYPKFENMNDNENLILPLNLNIQLSKIDTENILDNIEASDIAKTILNDRFDFTSSLIQKNGDYFYSYNNGQEILKISNSGYLEYKNEGLENIVTDINKSTETMLNFLSQLGISKREIIIFSVEEIEKNSGTIYRFNIRNSKDGMELAMQNSVSDSYVEVSGNMIISCKLYLRYITDYIGEKMSIVDPTKALNTRIEDIKSMMNVNDVEKIIESIQDINLYYSMDEERVLVPVWSFRINDSIFIIDAVTEELMNYGVVKN